MGCSAKKPPTLSLKPGGARPMPTRIAVMPVINHVTDPMIGQILRKRLINELYYKGYPRITAKLIDEKLAAVYEGQSISSEGIPPVTIGDLTGADAILYCTIKEMKTAYRFMYAPTEVELAFELRSAKTGETLWQSKQSESERNFAFTQRQLEMKSFQDYEAAISKILEKVMKTFPDAPEVTG
jgi:hypothetical protein